MTRMQNLIAMLREQGSTVEKAMLKQYKWRWGTRWENKDVCSNWSL